MDNALFEALAREMGPKVPKLKTRYSVMEKGFARERVIFETDDRAEAERIAGQHAARRVVPHG